MVQQKTKKFIQIRNYYYYKGLCVCMHAFEVSRSWWNLKKRYVRLYGTMSWISFPLHAKPYNCCYRTVIITSAMEVPTYNLKILLLTSCLPVSIFYVNAYWRTVLLVEENFLTGHIYFRKESIEQPEYNRGRTNKHESKVKGKVQSERKSAQAKGKIRSTVATGHKSETRVWELPTRSFSLLFLCILIYICRYKIYTCL